MARGPIDVGALVEGIRSGRRADVSRAITLVESSRAEHRGDAREEQRRDGRPRDGALRGDLAQRAGHRAALRVGHHPPPRAGELGRLDEVVAHRPLLEDDVARDLGARGQDDRRPHADHRRGGDQEAGGRERERHHRGRDRAPAPGGEGLQVPVGLGSGGDGRNH